MTDATVVHIAALHGHMDNPDIFLAPNEGASKPLSEEHYLLIAKYVVECTLVALRQSCPKSLRMHRFTAVNN